MATTRLLPTSKLKSLKCAPRHDDACCRRYQYPGARSELIQPDQRIAICRDPKDGKFLEVAVAGHAQVIVSGDDDLLVLDPFQGIAITTPARFLTMLDSAN